VPYNLLYEHRFFADERIVGYRDYSERGVEQVELFIGLAVNKHLSMHSPD